MSRKIEDLTPELQAVYLHFEAGMKRSNLDYIVTCTRRTSAEQLELYKKGRELQGDKWVVVDPKKCVTWTLQSRHIDGRAFDIAIVVNGKLLWNASLDADGDGVPEYTEAGLIGERIGLIWGGRFINRQGRPIPDAPHFEL